jgi:hypothetical protein
MIVLDNSRMKHTQKWRCDMQNRNHADGTREQERVFDRIYRMNRTDCQARSSHQVVMDFSPTKLFFHPVNPVARRAGSSQFVLTHPVESRFLNWIVPAKTGTFVLPQKSQIDTVAEAD